jgi:hypothetical protein
MTFDPLAVWGAVLATFLGIFRAYEFWRDRRPRLQTSYIWRGHAATGHDLLLINDSKVPASIYSLHLVWADPKPFQQPVEHSTAFDNEDDFVRIVVPPHGTERLTFSEADYFPTRPPREHPNARLYAKLRLVGWSQPLWVPITV